MAPLVAGIKHMVHTLLIKLMWLEVITMKAASFACISIWGRMVSLGGADRFWIQTPMAVHLYTPLEQDAQTY